MINARSFLRLAVAGFFVNALAIACVVDDDGEGDGDTCTPGATAACTCTDGTRSEKECNASGTGYRLCECDSNAGGNSSGGAGNEGGTGTTPAGGTGGTGGSVGGTPSTSGGADAGGAGGAGGADSLPTICQNPAEDDLCEQCYYGGCCDQWAACDADPDAECVDQFFAILACTDLIKEERSVLTADLEACAADVDDVGTGSWSSEVNPFTRDLVNCVAGEEGWEGEPWGAGACKASCFDKLD